MLHLGEYNTLTIQRETPPGLFLANAEGDEVLLPNRYVPEQFEIGESLEVFIYLDNEERPVATTDKPYITKGSFALLRCTEVTPYGAFLDWGLVKQLFCPFKEQVFKMIKGQWYLVYCYEDEKTNRLAASSKTNKYLDNTILTVQTFEEVDLIVSHPAPNGMYVIVNNKHLGLVYNDAIYEPLSVGDKLKGVVKKVRSDNKLDITLQQIGYKAIEPNAQKILTLLTDTDGFLVLTDKSSPEEIKEVLQMSKKAFKKAIGTLYKQQVITLKEDGIYLL